MQNIRRQPMRKFKIKDPEVMKLALQQEIIRNDEARYDHRLHGVLLVCSGRSCYEVAKYLGHSPRTIEYWVKRFERFGFSGLHDRERPGRPATFDKKIKAGISKDLRRSPREFGHSQNLWDGKLLGHHLKKIYSINLGVRQCQRLFHVFGFRFRKPRPVIAKGDPAAKREYKKTCEAYA